MEQSVERVHTSSHRRRLRGGVDSSALMGAGGCCFCLVVLYILVFATSAVIQPNHVGVRMSSITNQVDLSRVYHPGRHWFQPFAKFVLFPMTVQNVPMKLTTRTSDGYPLEIKAEFQYKLMPEKITDLYNQYITKYEVVYQRNVRAAIMKAMSEYDAPALFQKRVGILADMERRIDAVLRESYATCWSVQFDDVKQPEAFERTLILTQLQEWFSRQKLAEQKISNIQAKTQVLQAEFSKNTSVVSSTASNQVQYILSEATAKSSNYQNEAQSNATLLTDKAKATGSIILRQTQAHAELTFQEALASGSAGVLQEQAEATMRSTKLEGLRLQYWKDEVGLSETGLVEFQKVLGSYDNLKDVTFLFGFENAYATADASPTGTSSGGLGLGQLAAAASVAAQASRSSGPEL